MNQQFDLVGLTVCTTTTPSILRPFNKIRKNLTKKLINTKKYGSNLKRGRGGMPLPERTDDSGN